MKPYFVALELPQTLRAAIARFAATLGRVMPDASVVPERNFHLPLVFLADVPAPRLDALAEAIRAVATEARRIEIRLDVLEAEPNWRRPTAVRLGASELPAAMATLAAALYARLDRLDLAPTLVETPRVTIARETRPTRAVVPLAAPSVPTATLGRLTLYRTVRPAAGTRYLAVRAFSLPTAPERVVGG